MSTPHRAIQDLLAHVHDVPDDPGALASDDEAAALIRSAAAMERPDDLVRRVLRCEITEVYDVTVVLPESASSDDVREAVISALDETADEDRVLVDRQANVWLEEA